MNSKIIRINYYISNSLKLTRNYYTIYKNYIIHVQYIFYAFFYLWSHSVATCPSWIPVEWFLRYQKLLSSCGFFLWAVWRNGERVKRISQARVMSTSSLHYQKLNITIYCLFDTADSTLGISSLVTHLCPVYCN